MCHSSGTLIIHFNNIIVNYIIINIHCPEKKFHRKSNHKPADLNKTKIKYNPGHYWAGPKPGEKEEGCRQKRHPAIKEVAPKTPCMKNLRPGIGEKELEELDWEKTANLCAAWKADDKRWWWWWWKRHPCVACTFQQNPLTRLKGFFF